MKGSEMKIEDLTIGQARELVAMFAGQVATKPESHPFIGQYVLCRFMNAGVHCGELVQKDGDIVILKDSRRLWSWQAVDGVALSGVAQCGLKSGKVDTVNPLICVGGVLEIIPMSEKAKESVKSWK